MTVEKSAQLWLETREVRHRDDVTLPKDQALEIRITMGKHSVVPGVTPDETIGTIDFFRHGTTTLLGSLPIRRIA